MTTVPEFRRLTGIFEPSGIHQLADGRFVVVEDEERCPFSLLVLHPDGTSSSLPLNIATQAVGGEPRPLNDLEGVTVDRNGYVYAITSHSRDSDGEEESAREKLVRFRVENNNLIGAGVTGRLKAALVARHPVLAAASRIREVKALGGLNIEGLAMGRAQDTLLLGFRSPLLAGRAIIAEIENPTAVFDSGAEPRVGAELMTLDLAGNGIRGMCHIPFLGGYLIVGGPVARQAVEFQLWFWDGAACSSARRVTVAGLPGFAHAEGISPARIGGEDGIIIVSDDGDRKAGIGARFLLLPGKQLEIAD